MENNVFKVVLLQALPASGKSEVRNFMANIEPERLKKEFHIGENLQLDDFPYVHMMRCIDNELEAMGQARLFYPGEEPFIDGRDWGTLCCLLNEDYHDLLNRNVQKPDSCAQLLFDRYDRAGQIVGIAPRLGKLPEEIRKKLAEKLEAEAAAMLKEKQDAYPDSFDGKTIIIECARGGPDGASMPLTGSDGYQYSLPMFCPEILENAAALLAPGGVLVFSTCTFAPQEDEGQIANFLARHPEFTLCDLSDCGFGRPGEANRAPTDFAAERCRRIWPADGGEGHFMARLVKAGTPRVLPAEGEYTAEEQLWLAAAEAAGKMRPSVRGELL